MERNGELLEIRILQKEQIISFPTRIKECRLIEQVKIILWKKNLVFETLLMALTNIRREASRSRSKAKPFKVLYFNPKNDCVLGRRGRESCDLVRLKGPVSHRPAGNVELPASELRNGRTPPCRESSRPRRKPSD